MLGPKATAMEASVAFDRPLRCLGLSWWGLLLTLHVAACGGGTEGSEPSAAEPDAESTSAAGGQSMEQADAGFDTGVPGDKHSSELTQTEVDQVCDATRDYLEASVDDEDVCRALAAVASARSDEPAAACEAAYAECLDQREAASMLTCVAGGDDCDITVGEYEACVQAFVTSAAPILAKFPTCEDVTRFSLIPLLGLLELPECTSVSERCGLPFPEL